MTQIHSDRDNDCTFCWEQISRTNGLFRISGVFAPHECAGRLLPLYALFSAVEQIRSTVSDADVALSKLNWWRNELLQKNMPVSQHPLVRELVRTGAASMLSGEGLAALLNGAEHRLSASAPVDLDSLRTLCNETFRPQLELELNVCSSLLTADDFEPGLLVRNGLFQLVREGVRRKEQGGFWWIPHNSLARHGVGRGDILASPESPNVRKLMADILAAGLSWSEEKERSPHRSTADFSPARHVFAISGLYARKLKRLVAVVPDRYAEQLAKSSLTGIFTAWKCARRLS